MYVCVYIFIKNYFRLNNNNNKPYIYTLHIEIMELNEVLLILGIFIPSFIGVLWQLNRINPSKKGAKRAHEAVDTSLSELFGVQKEQIEEILKSKTNQIRSLEKKLRLESEESQIETTVNGKDTQVRYEDIQALVKKQYPDKAKFLDIPFVKKEVMKAVKGMTLDEALTMVENWTGKKISRDSKSQTAVGQIEDNPTYI